MKVEKYTYPHSSFLSIEKDMGLIVDYILKNENLKKLLYYTTKDCEKQPKLTEDQSLELFGKNIKIVPQLQVDGEILNYIIVNFDNFTPNANNPEFRDNIIEFDIICHFDQWNLQDFRLRPYQIAAELDSMLDEQHLTGIGTLNFLGANQLVLNSEFAGLCLMYAAIHGGEDKKNLPDENRNEAMIDNFNDIFNNE